MSSSGRKIVFGTVVGTPWNRTKWKRCAMGTLWCNAQDPQGPILFTTCWAKLYPDAIYFASSFSFLTVRAFP